MTFRVAAAALAVLALAAPVYATRHADLVYLQQFKARQKLLLADAAKAKPELAEKTATKADKPAAQAPLLAADDASAR